MDDDAHDQSQEVAYDQSQEEAYDLVVMDDVGSPLECGWEVKWWAISCMQRHARGCRMRRLFAAIYRAILCVQRYMRGRLVRCWFVLLCQAAFVEVSESTCGAGAKRQKTMKVPKANWERDPLVRPFSHACSVYPRATHGPLLTGVRQKSTSEEDVFVCCNFRIAVKVPVRSSRRFISERKQAEEIKYMKLELSRQNAQENDSSQRRKAKPEKQYLSPRTDSSSLVQACVLARVALCYGCTTWLVLTYFMLSAVVLSTRLRDTDRALLYTCDHIHYDRTMYLSCLSLSTCCGRGLLRLIVRQRSLQSCVHETLSPTGASTKSKLMQIPRTGRLSLQTMSQILTLWAGMRVLRASTRLLPEACHAARPVACLSQL
jgi:hypothetical protein